jgi:copper chaperone NosL
VRFLKSGMLDEKQISQKLVINFEKENEFIDAEKAIFWISPELKSPMGSNAAAFSEKGPAEKQMKGSSDKLMNWEELYNSPW